MIGCTRTCVHGDFVGFKQQIPLGNLTRKSDLPKTQITTSKHVCSMIILNTMDSEHREIESLAGDGSVAWLVVSIGMQGGRRHDSDRISFQL
jgi:hypothetical protein